MTLNFSWLAAKLLYFNEVLTLWFHAGSLGQAVADTVLQAELEGKYQKKVQELESQYAAMAPGVNPKGYLTYRIKLTLKKEEEVKKREDALKKPKIASGALVFG